MKDTALVEDIYELTPLQQGLLYHALAAPGSGAYVEQLRLDFDEGVNLDALQQAWQETVDRHHILRTAFYWEELDKPVQVVHREALLPLQRLDWRERDASRLEPLIAELLQADRHRGFDLTRAPLMRLTAIRRSERAHTVMLTFHHILLDGWSLSILVREVGARYEAACRRMPLHMPRSRPYADYITWLRQQDLRGAEGFWRKKLEGIAGPTLLISKAKSTLDAGEYHDYEVLLPEATTSALQELRTRYQVTPSTVAHAAWGALLSRYLDVDEVVFGTVVSGRPPALDGIESMIGLFINTLPLRMSVAPGTPITRWLSDIQRELAEIRAYEFSPLVDVHGWSGVHRALPMFDTLLAFENYPSATGAPQDAPSTGASARYSERSTYPMNVTVCPGRQLLIRLSWDSAAITDENAKQIAGHYATLFERIGANPHEDVGRLEMLTHPERHHLVDEVNAAAVPAPQGCLHRLFEAQVEATPDRVAVMRGDERVRYARLNAEVNQLARYLRTRHGTVADAVVGICLERSVDLVRAMIGVLKAGGAYLPLDPGYPRERLMAMVRTARVRVILTNGACAAAIEPPPDGCAILRLDDEWPRIQGEDDSNPASATEPHHLAYVMYTSGSTGRPKAVAVPHSAIVNHMAWMNSVFPLQESDRVIQRTSTSFDASVWEFYAPLLSGSTLVMAPVDAHRNITGLLEEVREQQVTVMQTVPSLLTVMTGEPAFARCRSLKRIYCGGEALRTDVVRRALAALDVEICNLYGPAETTVDATYHVYRDSDPDPLVPIGRPIWNTQLYVLDRHGRLAAPGVAGELYIGGAGVARGYLGDPDFSAERFVPDPFGSDPAGRLYRTGDVVRYREDGALEFLGRRDEQVKIHGNRVELGEIESTLREHPAVHDAAVLLLEDEPGDSRLVAYVASRGDAAALSSQSLADFLRARVPEYMVPARFHVLPALPLMPNGKLDKRALSSIVPAEADARDTVGPRDELERQIAAIWGQLLRTEKFGVTDNFFDLGGHSLLALRLISRVQVALGTAVDVREFFAAPTVAGMAASLRHDVISSAAQPGEYEEGQL